MKAIVRAGVVALGLLAPPALAEDVTDATRDVVMTHLRAYGALDAAAMAAPFSDDAVLITPERVYRGRNQIRRYMQALVDEFSQPGIAIETHSMTFAGRVAFLTWSAESPQAVYAFGADTYVVEDGQIVAGTSGASVAPK